MEVWRLKKMEPWRVYMPVVADLHHSDEEQDLGSGSASKWTRSCKYATLRRNISLFSHSTCLLKYFSPQFNDTVGASTGDNFDKTYYGNTVPWCATIQCTQSTGNQNVVQKHAIQILTTYKHCCGSVTFWYGFGSADPYLWLTDTDSDPASDPVIFYKLFFGFLIFCLLL